MRKSIRLTGRKQLPKSYFEVSLSSDGPAAGVSLKVSDAWNRSSFPPESEIRVKLVENKMVEVLSFGTLRAPQTFQPLSSRGFRAPSCQVRIVNRGSQMDGLLLGSTNAWTLKAAGDPEGILLFQAADIRPRLWKLELRTDEHPILYIDERIPDAALWARSDPVFTACVLPQVAANVLAAVLEYGEPDGDGWESDWAEWAKQLVPGSRLPFNADADAKSIWIDDVIDAFSRMHKFSESVISKLGG